MVRQDRKRSCWISPTNLLSAPLTTANVQRFSEVESQLLAGQCTFPGPVGPETRIGDSPGTECNPDHLPLSISRFLEGPFGGMSKCKVRHKGRQRGKRYAAFRRPSAANNSDAPLCPVGERLGQFPALEVGKRTNYQRNKANPRRVDSRSRSGALFTLILRMNLLRRVYGFRLGPGYSLSP